MFGDILTDEASMLAGSMGLLPSASLGDGGPRACTSRCTARRPTSPGKGIANPLATILSVAMLLRDGLGMNEEAARVEAAVESVLASGLRTPDLASGADGERAAGTAEMTEAVLESLRP